MQQRAAKERRSKRGHQHHRGGKDDGASRIRADCYQSNDSTTYMRRLPSAKSNRPSAHPGLLGQGSALSTFTMPQLNTLLNSKQKRIAQKKYAASEIETLKTNTLASGAEIAATYFKRI
uniref:Uncharacterized protein n=1 Tax=Plectus sambesii TaxID=2011161 RepID=A0A914VXJ0_9BILA